MYIHVTKYSGTSTKQPPRGMVNFGCFMEVAAQQRYSLMGSFETAGGLIPPKWWAVSEIHNMIMILIQHSGIYLYIYLFYCQR